MPNTNTELKNKIKPIVENKYQESLNHISELAVWTSNDYDVEPHKDLLQELVDKEKTMKPVVLLSGSYVCGHCYSHTVLNESKGLCEIKRCYTCGQRIDWRGR